MPSTPGYGLVRLVTTEDQGFAEDRGGEAWWETLGVKRTNLGRVHWNGRIPYFTTDERVGDQSMVLYLQIKVTL